MWTACVRVAQWKARRPAALPHGMEKGEKGGVTRKRAAQRSMGFVSLLASLLPSRKRRAGGGGVRARPPALVLASDDGGAPLGAGSPAREAVAAAASPMRRPPRANGPASPSRRALAEVQVTSEVSECLGEAEGAGRLPIVRPWILNPPSPRPLPTVRPLVHHTRLPRRHAVGAGGGGVPRGARPGRARRFARHPLFRARRPRGGEGGRIPARVEADVARDGAGVSVRNGFGVFRLLCFGFSPFLPLSSVFACVFL